MAKKKIGKAKKKPLKSYEVGVNVHYSSSYIVEARDEDEARSKAMKLWNGNIDDLPSPCVDVDWDETSDILCTDEEE